MNVEMMQNYAFEDGMEKGENKKAEESAVNLLKKGISESIITECLGLPLEKVQKLAETIKK
jgi:hypothetical protein